MNKDYNVNYLRTEYNFANRSAQNDMAAQLIDENGELKSLQRFVQDVQPIASHHVGAWLRTEYDTAVKRAHQAADFRQFREEAEDLPNLEWLPSTAVNPDPQHKQYWGTILPINDPFWDSHRPGDRWGCQCDLTNTDAKQTDRPESKDRTGDPQPGLENNPAKDGKVISDKHPYFPDSCSSCPFSRGVTNRSKVFFYNKKKDCSSCSSLKGVLPDITKSGIKRKASDKQRIENRKLYRKYMNDPNYKDVVFDEESGGMKATHIQHSLDPNKGFYETTVQDVGCKNGHSVILQKEPQNVYKTKVCEGLWDGMKFEIAGAETAKPTNIRNALKHCAGKPGTNVAVLLFPNKDFDKIKFNEGLSRYNGLKGTSQYVDLDYIYCINDDKIIYIKKAKR